MTDKLLLLLLLTSFMFASCQVLGDDMEMIRKAIIMAAENDTSYNYDQQDVYSSVKSDEDIETETVADEAFDRRNVRKIYNLSEILAGSSSMFERQKKKQNFMDNTKKSMHHNEQDDGEKRKMPQKRYYIYSHTKNVNGTIDDDDESDKSEEEKISRKIRSSTANKISDYDRKQVSKNISMVLENLLMSYENSQLPTHGQGVPTVVKTNILIRSMGPVSELNMDYSMDIYFRQYWRDSRLSFKSPINQLSLSIKMLERMWKPDTYFYNAKKSHIHTITVPNKLLRLSENGDILYSMRLTIRASCPMQLRNFPMDRQSCPLVLGSYAYTNKELVYEWKTNNSVNLVAGMTLSQFDLISLSQKNLTFERREGNFSTLEVSFNLQRHTGYFLIQVYVPCILIVILSWVSFWIHREATSDRVGLCITTVLTLSTISLDSRTDLPKVRYATALDWFLLMSFFYCIATLLEFAGVHYFTKVGSGEIFLSDDDDEEWENVEETEEIGGQSSNLLIQSPQRLLNLNSRKKSSMICPIYNEAYNSGRASVAGSHATGTGNHSHLSTMERTTQTEPPRKPMWKQFCLCVIGDDEFRRQRAREASSSLKKHVNSVSLIDRTARILFPASFSILNVLYWLYLYYNDDLLSARQTRN